MPYYCKLFLFLAGGGILLFFNSCVRPPTAPPNEPSSVVQGLCILNEGQWTRNNATITFYPDSGAVVMDIFSANNATALGDIAHTWLKDLDTLYIVVNNSRLIYKVQLPSFKTISQLALPSTASPRRMCKLNSNFAYVNSLLDNTIYCFNPQTMQLLDTKITVENYAEDMLLHKNKLYVTCGNYAYPTKNNKVAIINTNTQALERYLELSIENPGPIQIIDNSIWVAARGSYIQPKSALYKINPQTSLIDTIIQLPGNIYSMEKNPPYLYLVNDSNITRFNTNTYQVEYNYITKNDLNMQGYDLIYALTYAPSNNILYVSNAKQAGSSGEIIGYSLEAKSVEKRYPAGVFPKAVLRLTN